MCQVPLFSRSHLTKHKISANQGLNIQSSIHSSLYQKFAITLRNGTEKKVIHPFKMVTKARYVPMKVLVSNISFNFQLSGIGDGFTRSIEIVMMVPNTNHKQNLITFPIYGSNKNLSFKYLSI